MLCAAFLTFCFVRFAPAQPATERAPAFTIEGLVVDTAGKPIPGAAVHLSGETLPGAKLTSSDSAGNFTFKGIEKGTYRLFASVSGSTSKEVTVVAPVTGGHLDARLVVEPANAPNAGSKASPEAISQAMEFADQPNFTIAGVTDWTAAGGHGSDVSLRASEALTRETIRLAPSGANTNTADSSAMDPERESQLRAAAAAQPVSCKAKRDLAEFYLKVQQFHDAIDPLMDCLRIDAADRGSKYDLALALRGTGHLRQAREDVRNAISLSDSADAERLAGELDEQLGDPMTAVDEFERAARLNPSEQNYFEWGSELLLHRAILQAEGVFAQGAKAYPGSVRMLTAEGAALFAGAHYEEAAQQLCQASDLDPADVHPYLFMGKIVMVAPEAPRCLGLKLARFAQLNTDDPLANYFHAMALWKENGKPSRQVVDLLNRAVTLDPKCSDAYLQLGNVSASRNEYEDAIGFYQKAIDADSRLSEAHYRLGVAYTRVGERDKAAREFALHDEMDRREKAEVERERREVKQFRVIDPQKPAETVPQ